MKMPAIVSSMPFESDHILASLKNVRKATVAKKHVFIGSLSGKKVLVMNVGLGKVNAAVSSAGILEHFPVTAVMNIGVGGAFPGSGLQIGDIAVARKEIYGDEGVLESGGWQSLKRIGIPLVQRGTRKYFNTYPLDNEFPFATRRDRMIAAKYIQINVEGDFRVKFGNFVTVSAASGTNKRARELEKRFDVICENMEGAAIAHVCALFNTPMIEVRGISNVVGTRDKKKWDIKRASRNCQAVAVEILGKI